MRGGPAPARRIGRAGGLSLAKQPAPYQNACTAGRWRRCRGGVCRCQCARRCCVRINRTLTKVSLHHSAGARVTARVARKRKGGEEGDVTSEPRAEAGPRDASCGAADVTLALYVVLWCLIFARLASDAGRCVRCDD